VCLVQSDSALKNPNRGSVETHDILAGTWQPRNSAKLTKMALFKRGGTEESELEGCALKIEEFDSSLHFIAIAVVLGASLLGVILPRLLPRRFEIVFRMLRMLGIGIILSTAFIHVFLPAIHILGDKCAPEFFKSYEAWPAVLSLGGFLLAHLLDIFTSHKDLHESHDIEGGFMDKTSTVVLEFGIGVHSVLIGIALGISTEEFVPLLIAIAFHQFFEGLALSAVMLNIAYKQAWTAVLFLVGYVLSTPLGVVIGIFIRQACITKLT
jgi:zinc transporter 1/2/3